ncbi:winged helix-turn-helix domain-containing protein [Catellatospora coxensis]
MIDPHSGVPLHRQVADDLRRRIGAGEWAPGAHLPREVDLAHEYGVGLDTVRQAYEALRSGGVIRPGGLDVGPVCRLLSRCSGWSCRRGLC